MFDTFKALHLIFVVTWFAGLFYIVRLFIYHIEAQDKAEAKALVQQFQIMERRLWYGITWPSCILTLAFGLAMIPSFAPLMEHPWLMAKLVLVALLFCYHLACGHIYGKLRAGHFPYTSKQLRIWNEVATFLLVAIVFVAVLKNSLNIGSFLLGLAALVAIMAICFKIYQKIRLQGEKNQSNK